MGITILIIGLLLSAAYIVLTYNHLIAQIEAIRTHQIQMNLRLDRRFKLFEALIGVVKKHMDLEQTLLKDVPDLYKQSQEAKLSGNDQARIASENQISALVTNFHLVFEHFPVLKVNLKCEQLREEIMNAENKLAYARQSYNDSIEAYNANKHAFFTALIVKAFQNQLEFDFNYWQVNKHSFGDSASYAVQLQTV